jgi:hypothetical protein
LEKLALRKEAVATRNTTIRVDPTLAEAYNAAPKKEQERVQSAMRRVLRAASSGKSRNKSRDLSPQEARLILKIHSNLPERKRRRYHKLVEKRESERLTPEEHAELLRLADESENVWAERIDALAELARLRRATPVEVMKQLGITVPTYA